MPAPSAGEASSKAAAEATRALVCILYVPDMYRFESGLILDRVQGSSVSQGVVLLFLFVCVVVDATLQI
jgi:hypothetical protein